MQMFPHPRPEPANDYPLVDTMTAPELLATGASGMALMNGVVTITLESLRADHSKAPPPLERVVIGRLAMPVAAAQGLLLALDHFLGQHGLNSLPQRQETRQ